MGHSMPTRMDVIVYHRGCMDGLAAAYLVWKKHGSSPDVKCVGIPPDGTVKTSLVAGKQVMCVDVVPRNHAELAAVAETFWILDHHVTSQAKLADVPYAVFDMDRSATGLVWKTLNGDAPMPELYQAIQARDLWKAGERDSVLCEALHFVHQACGGSSLSSTPSALFSVFERMEAMTMDEVLNCGTLLLQQKAFRVEAATRSAVAYKVHVCEDNNGERDCRVAFLNMSEADLTSDVGSALMKEGQYAFAVLWRYNHAAEKYFYSLRSNDAGVDVGALCVQHGGGGHRNAAGFESTEPPSVVFNYEAIPAASVMAPSV